MARSKGFQGIVALKKGTTWGTAVAGGAGDGLYVHSADPGDAGREHIPDPSITGMVTAAKSIGGNYVANPSLEHPLWYEGLEPQIAFCMGSATGPNTVDTTAKQHIFKILPSLDGIFAALAYEFLKDTKIGEVPSWKVAKLVLSGKSGNEPLKLVASGPGFEWKDDSAINTTTTIDTVTRPANQDRAVWANVFFQMNGQAAGSLGSPPNNAVYLEEFELSIERGMDVRFSTQFGNKCDEPIDNGFLKVMLRLNFPAVQDGTGGNQSLMADQLAFAEKKAKLIITSTRLAGAATQFFQHVLWFPMLVPLVSPKGAVPGAEAPRWSQQYEGHHVGTIPTGFTAGYTDAVTWENYSQRAANALA